LSARLGRHAILLTSLALHHLRGRLTEPVILDHFETFEFTQDFPFGVATPVGRDSWFVYGLDPAPHPRTGKRSLHQQARLVRRPRRLLRGGYEASSTRTLANLLRLLPPSQRLELAGDGHPAYDRAVLRLAPDGRVDIRRYPNPKRGPKGEPRTHAMRLRDRAMFPVDSLHALLRHTLAHHRRETIAFGRRLNALMERLFLTAVWRNFVKRRSERKPDPVSPAMWVGLASELWTWRRVLAKRLFPGRVEMPTIWRRLYRRDWTTPLFQSNSRHQLIHAY
jgi:IS1 family transposase